MDIENVDLDEPKSFKNIRATLTGIGFEILCVGNEKKNIRSANKIHWEWQVIPKIKEAQMLNLEIGEDESNSESSGPTQVNYLPLEYSYVHELSVTVPWLDRIASFFQTYEVPISLVGGSLSFISIWNWIVSAINRKKRLKS